MTEISKSYKVMLFINMGVTLIYGVLYTFFWWWWKDVIGWDFGSTPWYGQVLGGMYLVIAIWCLRAVLQKKEWESITYFMEFTFGLMFVMLLFFAYEFIFVNKVPGMALYNSIVACGVVIILFILNLIFYFIETAKHK